MAPAQGPAGFRPDTRLHAQLSHAHRADPAAGALHPSGRRRLGEALGRAFEPAHARGVPRQLRNRVHGRSRQRGLRSPHRLGAGALSVSGPTFRRRAHRPAVRTADRGRRHRPDLALRDDGLDRAAPVRPRSPRRLHAPRASWSRSSSSACPSSCGPSSRCCGSASASTRRQPRFSARAAFDILRRVILPPLLPAVLTGFTLAFAARSASTVR